MKNRIDLRMIWMTGLLFVLANSCVISQEEKVVFTKPDPASELNVLLLGKVVDHNHEPLPQVEILLQNEAHEFVELIKLTDNSRIELYIPLESVYYLTIQKKGLPVQNGLFQYPKCYSGWLSRAV